MRDASPRGKWPRAPRGTTRGYRRTASRPGRVCRGTVRARAVSRSTATLAVAGKTMMRSAAGKPKTARGNFPPRRVINRRTRRRLRRKPVARAPRRGSAPEHVYALFRSWAAAATAAAELSTGGRGAWRHGGIRGRGDGRGRGEVRGASREGGGTRGGTRGAPTRVGRDERRGKLFAPRDPAAFDSPRGTTANAAERRRAIPTFARPAAARRRRARGWARASARGGGSGGGISVANDAGMGRRVGGGRVGREGGTAFGGGALREGSGLRGRRAAGGVGVGGRRGHRGPGPGAPAVARARRRSYRTRGGGESDGAGSEDE